MICDDCERTLPYIEQLPWQSLFPYKIGETPCEFDYANSLFWYKDRARRALLSLKYRNGIKFAYYSAKRLVLKFDEDGIADVDIVTAVPMNLINRVQRGYNQAEVIAKQIAVNLNLPYDFGILAKKFSLISQHDKKSAAERFQSASRIFTVRKKRAYKIEGKNILLCDDVFTSGATANACARLLKSSGANKVYVCTLCRTTSVVKDGKVSE
jgi:competence protein ComFC